MEIPRGSAPWCSRLVTLVALGSGVILNITTQLNDPAINAYQAVFDDLLYPILGFMLAKYVLERSDVAQVPCKVSTAARCFPKMFVGLRETSPKSSLG